MLRRSEKELTTEDAADDISPWEMLDDAGIATWTAAVREHDPSRNLTAFARRIDQDTVACFDKGSDGKGKSIVVLRHLADRAQTKELTYTGFNPWFDDVLAAAQTWRAGR